MSSQEALEQIKNHLLGILEIDAPELIHHYETIFPIIKKDLDRLEELQKVIEILKNTKNICVYFFDNGKRHYRIKFDRTREQEISQQEYKLLKEVLGNE